MTNKKFLSLLHTNALSVTAHLGARGHAIPLKL